MRCCRSDIARGVATRAGRRPWTLVGAAILAVILQGCGPEQEPTIPECLDEEIWYDGVDQDCDGRSDYDQDGDGYDAFGYGGSDCSDIDAGIHPGATETDDGVDEDCSGIADDHTNSYDDDGDGFSEVYGDCDDSDPALFPGAPEEPYDGIDQDCDGEDLLDVDGDGYDAAAAGGQDCDDGNDDVHPGATEEPYDGIDQDCDGGDLLDADGDGHDASSAGGDDCDDQDATVYPGSTALPEACGDGVDQDCDGDPDDGVVDADGDGHVDSACTAGLDCDDADSAVHPDAAEICGDVLDQDCSGGSDDAATDADADGFVDVACLDGVDCDDTDSTVYPGSTEVAEACGDGVDQDCSGDPDDGTTDADGDGSVDSGCTGGSDCNDADASIRPGAVEFCGDEPDQDCSGDPDDGADDLDGDGHVDIACTGGTDCDDGDGGVAPGATEVCGDAVDQDCSGDPDDGADDLDGDGYVDTACTGGTDCDDGDGDVSPGAAELCGDVVDQDCTGDPDDGVVDSDGDGFVDAACDGGDDCDDGAQDIHPNAVEICDLVDNDCDGVLDASGPADSYDAAFGGVADDSFGADLLFGNVYRPSYGTTLTAFEAYIDPWAFTGSVSFVVYVADSPTSGYGLVAETTVSVGSQAGWKNSGTLDVDLEAERYYLLGVQSGGALHYHFQESPSLEDDAGLTPLGGLLASAYTVPPSLSAVAGADQLYAQNLELFGDLPADADADGDGFSEYCGDCADSDPVVSPGAVETCDGVDEDCDGTVDGPSPDLDGDGFGTVCDCDDGDPGVSPAAPEVCDSIDNDCDGAVDLSGPVPAPEDDDTDGDGLSEFCGDCDDSDPTILPGAIETCDGVDEDCNGTVDGPAPDPDGDGHNQICDCDETDPAVNPGAAEVCDGVDNDCDGADDASGPEGDYDGVFGSTWAGVDERFCGNVYQALYDTTLAEFETYVDLPSYTWLTAHFTVMAASGPNETYSFVAETTDLVIGGPGWFASGPIDVELTAGTWYLIGVWFPSSVECRYEAFPSLAPTAGLAPAGGIAYGPSVLPTSTTENPTPDALYHQDLHLYGPDPADGDSDGDAVTAFCGDCDDLDETVFPGAPELCDGADNDCEGTVDGPAADPDGDGYNEVCDCDETEPSVNPGAPEVCDDIDNDCDGMTDLSGPESDYDAIFGSASSASFASTVLYGNVYTPLYPTMLLSFEAHLDAWSGGSPVYFAVFEADATGGPYSLVAGNPDVIDWTYGWKSSALLDVPMTPGHNYLVGVWLENTTHAKKESSPALTPGEGLSPLGGATYNPWSGPLPSSMNVNPYGGHLFHQQLHLFGLDLVDADIDLDDFTQFCGDCDDSDPDIHPAAPEVCGNGVDEDCDGALCP